MPWAKIDDDAPSHPKMFRAGVEAFGFWVAGNCFCNKRLTDGFVPQDAIALIYPGTAVKKALGLAERLVAAGLWERVEAGWRVHDYHEYNATADAIRKERQAAKERKDRWKEKRTRNADGTATERRSEREGNGVRNAGRNDAHARAATDPIRSIPPNPPAASPFSDRTLPPICGLCEQGDRQAGLAPGACRVDQGLDSHNCPRSPVCRAAKDARTP